MWGILGSIFTSLFGGSTGARQSGGQQLASSLADKILPETAKEVQAAAIEEEKTDIADVNAARSYNAPDMPVVQYQPGMGIIPFFLMWVLDLIDRLVDTVNHIIRPGVMIWLIGGMMKRWPLPDPNIVDPQIWRVFLIVITFFFGGRTLVKDVIPGVSGIIGMLKKK